MKIHHTLLATIGCLSLLTTALHAQVPNLVSYQGRVAVNGVNFDSTAAGHPGEFKFALVTTKNSVQATATASLSISGSGAVNAITVVNNGAGYSSFPVAVTITGGGGSGATAEAYTSLSAFGTITTVVVTNGGSGYTSPPTVVIAPPPPTYAITLWSHSNLSFAGSEPLGAPVPLQVTKGLYSVLLGDTSLPGMTQPIPASVWTNPDVRLRVWFSDGTPNGFQLLTPDQRLAPYGYLPDGIVTSTTLSDGAVSAAKLTDGAVTSTKLGSGAVQSGNIAAGAVTATELANGAITAAKVGSDVGLWSVNGAAVYRGSGNVGMGTANPASRLHLSTAGHTELSIESTQNFLGSLVGNRWALQSTGLTSFPFFSPLDGSFQLINRTAGATRLAVLGDGRVGIGTTNPGSTLQVEGGIRARGGAPGGNGGFNNGYAFASNGGDTDSGMFSSVDGQIEFYINAIERIRVNNYGDVGIGTTTPQAKLHVEGDIKLGTDSNQRTISSSGRMLVQSGEVLYLNPFVGGSNVVVGGGGAATNLEVIGEIVSHGITTAQAFGPANAFVGSPGNYIAFGHADTSEDFIGYKNNTFYFRDSPGGADETQPNVDVGGEVTCVALNITSDRNAKEQFTSVNAREVLDKVARLPISEWQYKQHSDARHIGPMAQDFREAFALGHDEKHITSVDADGVALAAIQGLNEKLEEQGHEKDTRIRELEKSVEELKSLMIQLVSQRNGGGK